MPKVLTVDDSRAVRMLVSKNAKEMGLEVDEAEDGQQGLTKTSEGSYDLIVLDVTMPVLDGPGMLQELRSRGDKTPVLMLTSESKRSIVASLMKMAGPAPGDEALVKEMASIVQAPSASDPKAGAGGKQFVDILCIDDMENV